jgi:protein subunit release factor A
MPSAYIELLANEHDAAGWLTVSFFNCVRSLQQECECEVVDEQYFDGTTQSSEIVIRVVGEVAFERVKQRVQASIGSVPTAGSAKVFEGACQDAEPDSSEVDVTYYRDPTKVNGFIAWTDSCVLLKHVPTGITARCQASRSRHGNYAGAMDLLKAKIRFAGV